MSFNRISNWFKDPITIIGFMNLFTMMELTLYRGYLSIFLTEDLIVTIFIFTIIVSSINFFQLFMRVPLAGFSQVIGRKPMILLGNLFIALAFFLLVVANHFIFAFISAILLGIGMSAHWPATFAYIQDVSPENYGKSNGRIFKIGDIGILIGSLFAKYLLDDLLVELRTFFLILFMIGIVSVFIFLLILPEVIALDDKLKVTNYFTFFIESIIGMFRSLWMISRSPNLFRIYMFQFFISFTEFMFATFFPLIVVYYGFSRGTVGEIIFWGTFILLWLKPYLGNLSDRFGYQRPVLVSLLVISLFFFPLAILGNTVFNDNLYLLIILILIYFVITAFIFVAYPAVNGATAHTASTAQRGIALGALGVYTSVGRTSSTVLLGPIWESFGLISVFIFTAFFIIGIVILLWIWTRLSKHTKVNGSEFSPELN
ncbi:MAG: MFS transporter [Candidatus Hodarchaeales archaeon]